ncbi:hypothetical protein [Moorena sp. SIO3A2]|uniref:hypothetical protein n=1 Tax=Moorena sp. SIO3A2 TaxID=2607841 RepID=UPI0013BDC339|nr:hypothetical protein [Moorena sp. SIO3A2]NER90336.1 hypothetical protein [Moorena sp. SIO3A2]
MSKDDFFNLGPTDLFRGNLFADNGNGPDTYIPGAGDILAVPIGDNLIESNRVISIGNGATFVFQDNGDFTFNPNGAYDSLAPGEEASPITFLYTYFDEDENPLVSSARITLQVIGEAATAPIAQSDVFSIAEDGQVFASLFDDNGNGRDEGDGPLTPTYGSR